MTSFATGILSAIVLAGVTWWAFEAGTISMVERNRNLSTENVWQASNSFGGPTQKQEAELTATQTGTAGNGT